MFTTKELKELRFFLDASRSKYNLGIAVNRASGNVKAMNAFIELRDKAEALSNKITKKLGTFAEDELHPIIGQVIDNNINENDVRAQ